MARPRFTLACAWASWASKRRMTGNRATAGATLEAIMSEQLADDHSNLVGLSDKELDSVTGGDSAGPNLFHRVLHWKALRRSYSHRAQGVLRVYERAAAGTDEWAPGVVTPPRQADRGPGLRSWRSTACRWACRRCGRSGCARSRGLTCLHRTAAPALLRVRKVVGQRPPTGLLGL